MRHAVYSCVQSSVLVPRATNTYVTKPDEGVIRKLPWYYCYGPKKGVEGRNTPVYRFVIISPPPVSRLLLLITIQNAVATVEACAALGCGVNLRPVRPRNIIYF